MQGRTYVSHDHNSFLSYFCFDFSIKKLMPKTVYIDSSNLSWLDVKLIGVRIFKWSQIKPYDMVYISILFYDPCPNIKLRICSQCFLIPFSFDGSCHWWTRSMMTFKGWTSVVGWQKLFSCDHTYESHSVIKVGWISGYHMLGLSLKLDRASNWNRISVSLNLTFKSEWKIKKNDLNILEWIK